jgi:thiamine biosynthesis protein ThiS
MDIKLNKKSEKLDTQKNSISIDELLKIKNFTFELLIVRINSQLIRKESYNTTYIVEGDDVEVIHVFGGG